MNGDIVPTDASEAAVRDEVNRRTAKAGYTTRYGECPYATKIMGRVSWGKTKLNIWPRDERGNLIP